MKRIAPELESLMWTLAEEGNDRAIDEFGVRHPELRTELLHRIGMVRGLRAAKKPIPAVAAAIPRFTPRDPRPASIQPRSISFIVGGLVLASLAAVAFLVTILLTPEKRFHKEDLPQPAPIQVKTLPPVQALPEALPPVSESDPVVKGLQSEAAHKSTSVTIDHAPLLTVLQMMSDISGTKIVAAPGMPNPNVDVDYHNLSAMEMLHELGSRYSFTPLDQGDGSILVVPAVDKSSSITSPVDLGGIRNQKIGG